MIMQCVHVVLARHGGRSGESVVRSRRRWIGAVWRTTAADDSTVLLTTGAIGSLPL